MNAIRLQRGLRTMRRRVLAVTVMGIAVFAAPYANAAELEFMGTAVTPAPGKYLVEKDVNVRAAPKTGSKRLTGLKAGDVVNVIGRAGKTAWLAVVEDGKAVGFVYGTVLSPVIDGEIEEDVTGEIRLGARHRCGYRVHFVGKAGDDSMNADTSFRAADYEVSIVCERDGKRIRFPAQMFMTEVPYDGSNKRQVFQINVDLLDDVHALPDVFSTIMMFDLDKGEVRFDTIAFQIYARESGGLASLPSTSVMRALASALEIAMTHWSDKAWEDIFAQAR
ncbi:SH3 domain-containing protein [Thalassospiraceae bacterium LMO-JJ14]|nr:SH3 domain-containing protein [Thalassospiraceae bacterium LMO-JJ14]